MNSLITNTVFISKLLSGHSPPVFVNIVKKVSHFIVKDNSVKARAELIINVEYIGDNGITKQLWLREEIDKKS